MAYALAFLAALKLFLLAPKINNLLVSANVVGVTPRRNP